MDWFVLLLFPVIIVSQKDISSEAQIPPPPVQTFPFLRHLNENNRALPAMEMQSLEKPDDPTGSVNPYSENDVPWNYLFQVLLNNKIEVDKKKMVIDTYATKDKDEAQRDL